jgi:hypothetical protein
MYAGVYSDPQLLYVVERETGSRREVRVPISSTEGVRLSGDGARLLFRGRFDFIGLGFLELESNRSVLLDRDGASFFSTDASGQQVVYWGQAQDGSRQYFLKDESGPRLQLTSSPDAVRTQPALEDCPKILGTRPLMTADGSRVFIITSSTLDRAAPNPAIGCRIFEYTVATDRWRVVAEMLREVVINIGHLSADGRWLALSLFSRRREPPEANVPPVAALLDTQTGELLDPAVDVGRFITYDALITGDGNGLVISSQADLDPAVGNADHNLELFFVDRASGRIEQITETTGGVDSTPGNCPSIRPSVNRDGSVLVAPSYVLNADQCYLDGPQRHEPTGMILGFYRAVRRRAGNQAPELEPIAAPHLTAGETLTLALRGRDADGDPLTFYAQVRGGEDVPPGSVMTDHHDGTATFTWATRPEHVGTTVVRFALFDEGGDVVLQDVPLTVSGGSSAPTASPTSTAPPATVAVTAVPPTATVAPACPADCDGNCAVTIAELLTATSIALGAAPLAQCP